MRHNTHISVIIPALNEASGVDHVIAAIPDWVDDVIVADNASTDGTGDVAVAAGARVVHVPHRGYGSACLGAIKLLSAQTVVAFIDADYSSDPQELATIVDPIVTDEADLVIGVRRNTLTEPGAMTWPQRIGTQWVAALIRTLWRVPCNDLGPFRAISVDALRLLQMKDKDYGWTVEMQIKAAANKFRVLEVPVSHRVRIGKSKISGTVRGVIGAGGKMLLTVLALRLFYKPASRRGVPRHPR